MKKPVRVIPLEDQQRMVAMLSHLHLFTELGQGGSTYGKDKQSQLREDLLCDWCDIQNAWPHLTPVDQKTVFLVGMFELTLEEAAERLGITSMGVCKRLYRAARHILERAA